VIPLAALQPAGAAIIGAATAAIVALFGHWLTGRRAERQRRREFYARALEATLAYREFAYAVPRRNREDPARERVRISEAMREIQRDLAYAESTMRIERNQTLGHAYLLLVAKTRSVSGGLIREAWLNEPIESDGQMNVSGGLDFSALGPFVDRYLDEVRKDMAWWRFWR
jgi:hypothetical protein